MYPPSLGRVEVQVSAKSAKWRETLPGLPKKLARRGVQHNVRPRFVFLSRGPTVPDTPAAGSANTIAAWPSPLAAPCIRIGFASEIVPMSGRAKYAAQNTTGIEAACSNSRLSGILATGCYEACVKLAYAPLIMA